MLSPCIAKEREEGGKKREASDEGYRIAQSDSLILDCNALKMND